VTLKVFNVNGREVATLVDNEVLTAGQHVRSWEAKNVTSGVYFYRVFAGDFQETKKMILTYSRLTEPSEPGANTNKAHLFPRKSIASVKGG